LSGAIVLSVKTPSGRAAFDIIIGTLLVFGAALAATSAFRSVPMVLALLYVSGVAMVVGIALCNTSIQQRVPDDMRGRVLSMYTFAFFAFIPFGNLLSGVLAERRGIAVTLVAMGAGLIVSALAIGAALFGGWPFSPRRGEKVPR
jgi:hypothetical protein